MTGVERELTPWLRARLVIDRVVAALAAALTAPVVAVLAVRIRRDGGPSLIRVPRVGRHGHVFGMWKLRSMRAERADGLATGSALTRGADDARITPIGARLRAYHLDELPQLWNVALGEMSLLGPRPEAPAYVDADSPVWSDILAVPPGIAGPTQLIVADWERDVIAAASDSGYRSVVLPVKLAIDRWYLDTSSPATDALVAITLLRRFLPGTGAWTLRRRVFTDVPASAPARAYLQARQAAHSSDHRSRVATAQTPGQRLLAQVAAALDQRVSRRSGSTDVADLRPRPGQDVWSVEIDGSVVLFDAPRQLAHHLSPEAALIWQRCDGTSSVRSIAAELADGLGLDPIQVLGDAGTAVLQLIHVGALEDPSETRRATERRALDPAPKPFAFQSHRPGSAYSSAELEARPARLLEPTYDAIGHRFRVRCDDAELADHLGDTLTPLAVMGPEPEAASGGDADAEAGTGHVYDLVVAADDSHPTSVYLDGTAVGSLGPRERAILGFLWLLKQQAVQTSDRVVLHADVVRFGGVLLALPADPESGRNALTPALVEDGFAVVGEELVTVGTQTLDIRAFPPALTFETSPQGLFPNVRSGLERGDRVFEAPVGPPADPSGGPGGLAEGPLGLLLVAEATSSPPRSRVERLSPPQALAMLLGCALNLEPLGPDGLRVLSELVASVPTYRLRCDDPAEVRQAVRDLRASSSTTNR